MQLINLNGSWKMKRTDELQWTEATVPGSVYHDLLQAGKMPDPFYRDNEYEALALSDYDYEYCKSFHVDEEQLLHDKIYLLCEGLDTLCDIFLNDIHILSANNMHRTYEVDIKGILTSGNNKLYIIFHSPVKFAREKQAGQPMPNLDSVLPGVFQLRKAHCMFGWDWGPQLPDMGIWRNISIVSFNGGRIDDIYITQEHFKDKVLLGVRIQTHIWNAADTEIKLRIQSPSGDVIEKKVSILSKEQYIVIEIKNPQLWWPNNLGEHPLYHVEVVLCQKDNILDSRKMRIGLRTLTVKRDPDEFGESFTFRINGISIFSMGADYIPEDAILSRQNREKTERLIKSCIQANYNTIRVWGGAFFPEDYFYDFCDENGLIVWQDLMFACGVYEFDTDFKENIAQEITDNMKRIRHHACLGLWCGNNEQELAWFSWGWSEQFSPKLKGDYIKQFEMFLPELAENLDPNTFYWTSSPSSGGSFDQPNNQNCGDVHFWGVWHGKRPFTEYRKICPRYMSEFGLQSFPCLKTVKTFTAPEDGNIFSYVMESHQKSGTGNEKILHYIGETYKYPKDLDSLLYISQLTQADAVRCGVEHWRRNRIRCMGAVYWQLNDCWPVVSWSSIDYFGRWKALHYAAKKFFAPILISACEDRTSVSLHISNETTNPVSGKCVWKLMDNTSSVIKSEEITLNIAPLSSNKITALDFSALLDSPQKQRGHYLAYSFSSDSQIISSGTVLFVKPKHFDFAEPAICVDITEREELYMLKVESSAFAKGVELNLKNADAIFSDNFFDLSADDPKWVKVQKDDLHPKLSLSAFKEQLTVRSLFDTYEK